VEIARRPAGTDWTVVMQLEKALQIIGENTTQLEQLGVESLAIFGSVARREASPTSDIDILVAFKSAPTFDQYIETKFFLEDLLGCKVDLVTQDGLKNLVKTEIEKEAVYVS
jgi:predicted nucleotidyltransferase